MPKASQSCRLMVVSPNPNLLLLVQLISRLADTFDMYLIQSGILARGVEVEAMDESEGPPPRKRGRPFTTGKIVGGAYCSAVGCHNNEGRDRARGIKFYRFPKDNKRCKEWITKVNRLGPRGSLWTPSRAARLCSEHFVGGQKNDNPLS